MDFSAIGEVLIREEPGFPHVVLGALLIFACRVTDMSIDTLRVLSLVRGHKFRAALFGFLEAGIFIVALAQVFRPPIHWLQMLGYAAGFGVGTLIGVTIAQRVSSEFVLMRVLSRENGTAICERLRGDGIAVTSVVGEGRDGPVLILFSVVRRGPGRHALEVVREADPKAFVVLEPIQQAIGGYIPNLLARGVAVRR